MIIAKYFVRPSFKNVCGVSMFDRLRPHGGIIGSAPDVGAAVLVRFVDMMSFCCGFSVAHVFVCAAPFSRRVMMLRMNSCLKALPWIVGEVHPGVRGIVVQPRIQRWWLNVDSDGLLFLEECQV